MSGIRKSALVVLVTLACLFGGATAHAFCGFYVSGADGDLFNNATMVVMMREGKRTVLSMQNNYEGPPEDFALVVPVPVVLQEENVKTLPAAVFDRVDKLAAPRLVEYWEQDPCAPEPQTKGRLPRTMAPARVKESAKKSEGVVVEAQFKVGEYEIVILSASDSAGLDEWLKQEGYNIPDGAEPLLRPYVEEGSKFFVAKVDLKKVKKDEQGRTMLSPLRFHYDTDKFSLPIRLGLMNAKGAQDLIVHILARNQRYEVANYENVTIPTNIDVAEKAKGTFGAFYAALFDATVKKNAGAVVTEYAWDSSTCDPCPVPGLRHQELATLGLDVLDGDPKKGGECDPKDPLCEPGVRRKPMRMRRGFVLTRLHARYTKDSLGEDLVFKAADPIVGGRELRKEGKLEHGAAKGRVNNFQGRYAIRHPWAGPIECKDPKRGRWGGPPREKGGGKEKVSPALDLAFAKRGGVELASLIQTDVPELGLQAPAEPAPEPAPAAAPSSAAPAPQPAADGGGACGCRLVGAGEDRDGRVWMLWLGMAALAVLKRRARERRRSG